MGLNKNKYQKKNKKPPSLVITMFNKERLENIKFNHEIIVSIFYSHTFIPLYKARDLQERRHEWSYSDFT